MGLDPNILKTFEPIRDRDEEIYWVGAPALVPFLTSGIPCRDPGRSNSMDGPSCFSLFAFPTDAVVWDCADSPLEGRH